MKIKKLEWCVDRTARGVFGQEYYIEKDFTAKHGYDSDGFWGTTIGKFESWNEAKAACQKHFEEEVMEYLEND